MHQKQTTPLIGIKLIGKTALPGMAGQAVTLILDLPDQPVRRKDASDPQALSGISVIAVTHRIHQCLLQTQLKARAGLSAVHRLKQQLHQRTELECGRKDEISPPQ
tara:strand:+ start:3220 stop:3537 length:318 start_codon:yes stop_codon:yes gene_type:complete